MHPAQWAALLCLAIALAALLFRGPYAEMVAGLFGLAALVGLVVAPRWSSARPTKACPDCGERVPERAQICPICGHRF